MAVQQRKRGAVVIGILAILLGVYGLLLLTGATNIRHLIDNVVSAYLLAWALYGMFARVPLSEVGTRFLLTTGTFVLCWLLAEGVALVGAVDYRTRLGTYEQDNPLSMAGRQFDHELLWRHEPYYHYEALYQGNLGAAVCTPPDPARKIVQQYDKHGFRNQRDLLEADLVVIGDSYIEGYFTSDAKLITTILGELQGTSVANLGHSGYGPQQELAVLRRFGLPLKPKTIVWAFFEGNDFSDTEAYDKKIPIDGNAFWQDFWFRSLTRNMAAFMFRSVQWSMTTNASFLLRPDEHCVPNTSMTEFRADFTDRHDATETVFFAPFEVKPVSGPTLRKAAAIIAQAAKLCRERHIRFVVAFVPEKFRVYHDLGNVTLATDAIRQWRITDLPDQMRRHLTELEPTLEYIDLTPALKAASRAGIATYLADDTHWTDEGNRVAAETIHRALQRKPTS